MNANPNAKPEDGPASPWKAWNERPDAPDEICRALANGSTLKAWARSHDFDHYSVWHWLRTNPACAEQYKGLADFRIDRLLDEMLELADDSSQDLLTDDKGKVKVNRAHFTRIRIQLDTRKTALRQLTTARRLAKDEKPQWSYEEEILKLGNDDTPYDPTGLITATKPSYNPGPPPLSAATRQLGAAPGILSPPTPNLNPTPNPPSHAVGMASTPSPFAGSASASTASISERGKPRSETSGSVTPRAVHTVCTDAPAYYLPGEQPTTNHEQRTANQPTFSSYKAYLRAIWESGWVEGTPLPFVYRPTPNASHPEPSQDAVGMASQSAILTPQSAMDGPHASVPVQASPSGETQDSVTHHASRTTSSHHASCTTLPKVSPPTTNNEQPTTNHSAIEPPTKQTPQAMVGGGVPKIDWHKIVGVRRLSAFLLLLWFCVSQFVLNLHASIHSLSAPTGNYRDRPSLHLPSTLSDTSCPTWTPPRSEVNPPRTTNHEQQTNPAQHFRHSRDAP